MRTCLAILAMVLIVGLGRSLPLVHAEPTVAEYRLQAAFLLNFARFTQWPSEGTRDSSFVVGILGRDPFGGMLSDLEGQSVGERPVQVRYAEHAEMLTDCQLVYISASVTPDLNRQLEVLRGRPILLVSDIPRFAERGGHIELFTRQNKMRFRINLAVLDGTGLQMSSKLLRLAELVEAP